MISPPGDSQGQKRYAITLDEDGHAVYNYIGQNADPVTQSSSSPDDFFADPVTQSSSSPENIFDKYFQFTGAVPISQADDVKPSNSLENEVLNKLDDNNNTAQEDMVQDTGADIVERYSNKEIDLKFELAETKADKRLDQLLSEVKLGFQDIKGEMNALNRDMFWVKSLLIGTTMAFFGLVIKFMLNP